MSESDHPTACQPGTRRRWGWVAGGACVVLWAAALGTIVAYGANVPRWDDLSLIPYLAHPESITAGWLWDLHAEHRIPLPRFLHVGLLHLTGDFRAGMFLSGIALGVTTLALLRAAARLRGWPHPADVLFPCLLLNGGHSANLLWGFQIHFPLSLLLASAALVVLVRQGNHLSRGLGAALGVCLLLLALCGGAGLVFVPPLALWLGWAGVRSWRASPGTPKPGSLAGAALAAAALAVVGLYFVGYESATQHPSGGSLWEKARAAVQFGSMAFGHVAWTLWPFSALATVGVGLVSGALLVAAVWHKPAERGRAAGLLLFLVAIAGMAVGVGWGRVGLFGYLAGLQPRYATLAVLLLCHGFFVVELYSPRAPRPWLRGGLVSLAVLIAVLNVPGGLRSSRELAEKTRALEQDVYAGVPPYRLISRYGVFLGPDHEGMTSSLRQLRDARVGAFRALAQDPPFDEVPLDLEPAAALQMVRAGSAWEATGSEPCLVFALPEPRHVAGIRIRYGHANDRKSSPIFQMDWRPDPGTEYSEERRFGTYTLPTGPGPHSATVWIDGEVAEFRIHPDDRRCTFELKEVVLLIPSASR